MIEDDLLIYEILLIVLNKLHDVQIASQLLFALFKYFLFLFYVLISLGARLCYATFPAATQNVTKFMQSPIDPAKRKTFSVHH